MVQEQLHRVNVAHAHGVEKRGVVLVVTSFQAGTKLKKKIQI
jgi:hypothetical protein